MPPKKKKSAAKKSSRSTKDTAGHAPATTATTSTTDTAAARTRLPIADVVDGDTTTAATAPAPSKEAALLFWVNSALSRFSRPAQAPQAVKSEATSVAATAPNKAGASPPITVVAEEAAEQAAPQPAPSAPHAPVVDVASRSDTARAVTAVEQKVRPGHETAVPPQPKQPQQEEAHDQTQPAPLATLAATSGPAAAQMKDALPIFEALVDGQLGDVAIDLWLLGQVSLTHHPDAFARALEDHEQAASGPQRALLNSVVPYFLVRGESFYTVDAAVYPTLPLIALLLRSPKVRKVVLHPPLLYRLLFTYLGTDKVEIANVVDLGTWLTTARQGSSALATSPALDRLDYDKSSHTLSVEALRQALPHDSQSLLEIAIGNAQRALFARTGTEVDAPSPSGSRGANEVSSRDASDEDAETHSDTTDDEGEAEEEEVSEEAVSEDAVDLLQQLQPCAASDEPGGAPAPRRRQRRARWPGVVGGSATLVSDFGAADATRALEAFTGMSSVYRFYEMILAPALQTTRLQVTDSSTSSSSEITPSLTDVCARRTYAVFLCALMSYHGFYVSRTRFETMMGDLDSQLRDLAQQAAMVLDNASPKQAPSVVDAVSQPDGLLLALSAQEVVDYVQTQLIDEDARRAIDAIGHSVRGGGGGDASEGTPRLTVQHVESCLEVLESLSQCTPPTTTTTTTTTATSTTTAATRTTEAARAGLQRSGALVRLWLAVQERRTFRKVLTAQFSTANATLQVHVLPSTASEYSRRGADGADGGHSSLSSNSGGDTTDVAVVPATTLTYSVHPQWEMHLGTTGRLFAARPNVQTIPKQAPAALYAAVRPTQTPVPSHNEDDNADGGGEVGGRKGAAEEAAPPHGAATTYPMLRDHPAWTLRHLYTAPPGCVLVSLDFNQVELRVLAHLSRDPTLVAQLSDDADVLAHMAQTVLRLPSPQAVQLWQRQAIKVIVYGLLYGMGPELMNVRLAQLTRPTTSPHAAAPAEAMPPLQAKDLLDDFYASYPLVRQYLLHVRATAMHQSAALTLGGLKHLTGPAHQDANRRRQAAVAWAIQGGAADLLHEAMQLVHQKRHAFIEFLPAAPIALIAAAHDELIYAVPAAAVSVVLPKLRAIMEHDVVAATHLRVPLRVTARVGPSLGELEKVDG